MLLRPEELLFGRETVPQVFASFVDFCCNFVRTPRGARLHAMSKPVSSKALCHTLCQALLPTIQCAQECQAIVQRLLAHYFQVTNVQLLLDVPIAISASQQQLLEQAIQRLYRHEPLQYIIGLAPFLGRDFLVNPTVLIPRPETEVMVQHILDENRQKGLQVLDLCTGSGCIAITLQQELHQAVVCALDVDAAALRTAQQNAQKWEATVQFYQADLLQEPLPGQRWDLIVSNPPYVRLAESAQMQRCVLDYEPRQAIFVPDERPLLFYERIAALAQQHLMPGGRLYLEINEAFGTEVAQLLTKVGLEAVRTLPDLHGKDRWVQGEMPSN